MEKPPNPKIILITGMLGLLVFFPVGVVFLVLYFSDKRRASPNMTAKTKLAAWITLAALLLLPVVYFVAILLFEGS